MQTSANHRSIPAVVLLASALVLLASACAASATGDSGGEPTLRIMSPNEGASVSEPFLVKIDASVPLGDPGTGEDHVHLCFDGRSCDTEYTLVFGNTFEITDLPPGAHTIEASLRHADHSDTGVTTTVSITVDAAGAGSSSSGATGPVASGSGSGSGGRGYGYGT